MVTAANMVVPGDRALVERFASMAAQYLGEQCVVVMLLPWCSGVPPPGVLVPGNEINLLDAQEVQEAAQIRQVVLVPCTYENQQEELAARRILPQFSAFEHVCVFMAHLIPADLPLDTEMSDTIMRRHDSMLANGADDVLMDPDLEPQSLLRAINLARATWELNVRRMQLMLDAEPEPVSPEVLRQLQMHHRRILWESTPRALMPHLRVLDRHLVETGHSVDRYRLISRVETVAGTVLHAVDDNNQSCAIKVINKAQVFTPGELEGIYREYRFLSEIIRHPNVVRCLTMLHSTSRLYLIFEYAGNHNLAQLVSSKPGQRFDEEDTLNCFDQVVMALAHCHSKDVAHRSVSMEHIVVNKLPSNEVSHCQLCDFRSAMVARGTTTSKTVCGSLPCMAPEIANGSAYVPRFADCWSAGIVLLETAGGLGSLSRSIQYDPATIEPQQVAGAIQQYFSNPGSLRTALASIGGVESTAVTSRLEVLLRPNADERATMQGIQVAARAA